MALNPNHTGPKPGSKLGFRHPNALKTPRICTKKPKFSSRSAGELCCVMPTVGMRGGLTVTPALAIWASLPPFSEGSHSQMRRFSRHVMMRLPHCWHMSNHVHPTPQEPIPPTPIPPQSPVPHRAKSEGANSTQTSRTGRTAHPSPLWGPRAVQPGPWPLPRVRFKGEFP
jgi:hypothetical protein